MKVIILAGGLGTRISEETDNKPKPMIEIGELPILLHIIKIYSSHNINDFIICCGYKGHIIRDYFKNFFSLKSDVTFNMQTNEMLVTNKSIEPWKITLVDTGLETMTGGRLKRVQEYIKNEEAFCLTYGDGLANINVLDLISFHKKHGKLATLTAVRPISRYGVLNLNVSDQVLNFEEKPKNNSQWINGGFFVLSPEVLNYIKDDKTIFEKNPLEKLSKEGELFAYKHNGFWMAMDSLKDKVILNELWNSGEAPWKN
jgi:glucose-1-phosphate cytidylyltransferase